jgi:hypothetical protein
MDDFLSPWIAAAFSATNAIRVVFYVPQIVAVARSESGARDSGGWPRSAARTIERHVAAA